MKPTARILVACLIVVWMTATAQAFPDKTHEGKVVSVTAGVNEADGKLVMTDNDGANEHTHMISSTVKITLDGKTAKLMDLKKGDAIKVSTNDAKKVTAVAATRSAAGT